MPISLRAWNAFWDAGLPGALPGANRAGGMTGKSFSYRLIAAPKGNAFGVPVFAAFLAQH
jgi:hypothetical protein